MFVESGNPSIYKNIILKVYSNEIESLILTVAKIEEHKSIKYSKYFGGILKI